MDSTTVSRLSSRPAEPGAWLAIREICCRTANNGEPIARERWDFFARVWIDPYEKIQPEWTYVAERGGAVVGYLTGCADTRAFERAKRRRLALPLLMDVTWGAFRRIPGARRLVLQQLGIKESAERSFSPGLRRRIGRDYPAHLHMNVEREFRRAGVGSRLLEAYLGDLRRAAVPGVHLFCGPDPVAFYGRAGFQVFEVSRFRGGEVYAMGQRLGGG